MKKYDNLITWLTIYYNFDEIAKDAFLYSLYLIWDMDFWDDEWDTSPLKAKCYASKISNYLKIDIHKNKSWTSTSNTLQKQFFGFFYDKLKRQYLKKDVLYIISTRKIFDNKYGLSDIIYEIPDIFADNNDKQIFIEFINELIDLNQCTVAQREINNFTLDDVKNVFQNITLSFLHIICKYDKSLNERSKALMLRITENEVNALTGKHTNNMNGMYFKIQLPSLSSNTDFKKEIDENTGILHINTIKIITQDITAKCSDS